MSPNEAMLSAMEALVEEAAKHKAIVGYETNESLMGTCLIVHFMGNSSGELRINMNAASTDMEAQTVNRIYQTVKDYYLRT